MQIIKAHLRLIFGAVFAGICCTACELSAQPAATVQPVVNFDPGLGQFPEGLAIDKQGNVYAALTFTGNVWKMSPDGSQTILAHLDTGNGILVGMAVDSVGNLYVCDASFVVGTHGIWRISPVGTTQLFAALDVNGFPNAMAFDRVGNLYVTDSFLGQIYKITRSGQVSIWLADPLLAPGDVLGIGANGIQYDSGYLYVANTDQGSIVRVAAGAVSSPPEIFVQDSRLIGADGIAFDVKKNLYVAVDIQNALLAISPRAQIAELVSMANGLDYPASVSFGQGSSLPQVLYWTNSGINFGTPSIQRMRVPVPGLPLP